jgi:hypothetical protein
MIRVQIVKAFYHHTVSCFIVKGEREFGLIYHYPKTRIRV